MAGVEWVPRVDDASDASQFWSPSGVNEWTVPVSPGAMTSPS
jgi:hypothetical protein